MIKTIAVLFCIFLPGFCTCQCLKHYEYHGPRGSVIEDSMSTMDGSILYIDFSTMDVPDKITLFTCSGNFSFYTGSYNDEPLSNFIKGFGLVELYGSSSWTIYQDSSKIPEDYRAEKYSNGQLRIIYRVNDCCKLRWKIEGNKKDYTVFSMCISIKSIGINPIDTIFIPHCNPEYSEIVSDSCAYHLNQFVDSSIQIQPIVHQPSCALTNDGSIEFPNFQSFNLYNIGSGLYSITVSNSVCFTKFDVIVNFENPCNIFIPNVFSPNDDGLNDSFYISTDFDFPYELSIYSRWGELIHKGSYISNQKGWDPKDRFEPGVYAYRIILNNQIFSGDVTLLR